MGLDDDLAAKDAKAQSDRLKRESRIDDATQRLNDYIQKVQGSLRNAVDSSGDLMEPEYFSDFSSVSNNHVEGSVKCRCHTRLASIFMETRISWPLSQDDVQVGSAKPEPLRITVIRRTKPTNTGASGTSEYRYSSGGSWGIDQATLLLKIKEAIDKLPAL